MSHELKGEGEGPLGQLHMNGAGGAQPQDAPSRPSKIIEISQQPQKKEVIEIEDSGEDKPRTVAPPKPKPKKVQVQPRKAKKMSTRCMACRDIGKKSEMKTCLECRGMSHITCLEQQEGYTGGRYRCQKCKRSQQQLLKSSRPGEKGQDEKLKAKRAERQRKRQEQQQRLKEFQERYPFYIQDGRVRYPIEDHLLFIYRELFDYVETTRPKPVAHRLIPGGMLADFLQVENFCSTFGGELGGVVGQVRKSLLYISLDSQGIDSTFAGLVESVLKLYLSDIFDKNKTDNIRILNDHPFFTLLTHLHQNSELTQEVVVRAAPEIMRYLAIVPSMKRAFDDLTYPQDHNLTTKLQLVLGLIKGLSEVDEFHALVALKSEKMQLMTKERTELVAKLKIDEAENLSNMEKLKDMGTAERQMEEQSEVGRSTKELDKHKKKMARMANEQTRSQEVIRDIKQKIAQISKIMPFLTTQLIYLGKDRNGSEYFFYIRQPSKVYVKYRTHVLDENEQFYIYEGRETVTEVFKSLNNKGLKEKYLAENLSWLLKDEILEAQKMDAGQDASNFIIEESPLKPITLSDVHNLVTETEETFSVYLTLRKYQWAAPAIRETTMNRLITTDDLHSLKEQVRSLQENFLFAENMSQQDLRREESEEENRQREYREGRKKIPIRIWGINSEKIKKYWVQYLEECIDVNGIWLCAYIFKNNVDKYVKKKMEVIYEQQAKEEKERQAREKKERARFNQLKREERLERKYRVPSPVPSPEPEPSSEESPEQRRPNLRKRNHKKMNIQSEQEVEPQKPESDSGNDDCCEICGEYGDMICCDTCPRVYHPDCLKITDIPQGNWSCFKCLEKLSQERQTRSRVKRIGRFL